MHKKMLVLQIVFYFAISAISLFGVVAGIYYFLIEPHQAILVETTVPEPQRVTVYPGEKFKYKRNVVQRRNCKAEVVHRVLECDNGYRHHYPDTAGGFAKIGPYNPLYTVKLPNDVPSGECKYQVSGQFHCALIRQFKSWHPIYVTVLKGKRLGSPE